MNDSGHPHAPADTDANGNATASPHLLRPSLWRSVSFCCGLMMLVFLLLTWAIASRESRLYLFQSGGGTTIWAFHIDSDGYGLRHSRPAPSPPQPAGTTACSVAGERMPLPRPLGWERYQAMGERATRLRIDHWLLIATHLALWGAVTYGTWRRWGRGMHP